MRKNDFEKLCDEIENCNDMCESNPIICARHYVNKYTLKDKDRLDVYKRQVWEHRSSD